MRFFEMRNRIGAETLAVEVLAERKFSRCQRMLWILRRHKPPQLGLGHPILALVALLNPVPQRFEIRRRVKVVKDFEAFIDVRDFRRTNDPAFFVDPDSCGNVHQIVEPGDDVGLVDENRVIGFGGLDRRAGGRVPTAVFRD